MCSINNRTNWYATIVMAAASLPLVSVAQGAVTYAFDKPNPNYQVLKGAAVSVPLYLTFTGTDLAALNAGNGLASAGVYITTLTAPASPAFLSGFSGAPLKFDGWVLIPDPTAPGDFMADQSGTSFPASSGRLYFFAITPSGGVAATASRVLLGNLDFVAGATAGQTTTFNVEMLNTPTWWASTAGAGSVNPVAFDTIGSSTVAVTVIPIPEPATALSLVVLGGAALLARGQRRQRHQSTPK